MTNEVKVTSENLLDMIGKECYIVYSNRYDTIIKFGTIVISEDKLSLGKETYGLSIGVEGAYRLGWKLLNPTKEYIKRYNVSNNIELDNDNCKLFENELDAYKYQVEYLKTVVIDLIDECFEEPCC